MARGEKKNSTNSTRPTFECYLNNDATPEALLSTIGESNGITIYRDELVGWFNDFGRYARSGEVENYLSIYNNTSIRVNRKGENITIINDPFLSVIGTTQPNTLKRFLKLYVYLLMDSCNAFYLYFHLIFQNHITGIKRWIRHCWKGL